MFDMETTINILFSLAFPVVFAWLNSWHYKEANKWRNRSQPYVFEQPWLYDNWLKTVNNANRNWHFIQAGLQCMVWAYVGFLSSWWTIPMNAFMFWLIFDVCVNVFSGRKPFYTGTSSVLDRIKDRLGFFGVILQFLLAFAGLVLYVHFR